MSAVEITVTYAGRSMVGRVSGSCLYEGKTPTGEQLQEIATMEVMGILRRLLGPTEGIRSFELGDTVTNSAGEERVVHTVDRVAETLGLALRGSTDLTVVPIAGWRPLWTIPDSERK